MSALEIVRHACGSRTDDLVLHARLLDVSAAVDVGLIDEAVAPEDLLERAAAVAAELAELPAEAYAMAKHQLRAGALERIERDAPMVDRAVADRWAADDTVARIRAQLERLRSRP